MACVSNHITDLKVLLRKESGAAYADGTNLNGALRDRYLQLSQYYQGLAQALPDRSELDLLDELRSLKVQLDARAESRPNGLEGFELNNMRRALDVSIRLLTAL